MLLLLTHSEKEIGNRAPFGKFTSDFDTVKYSILEFHQIENVMNISRTEEVYFPHERKKNCHFFSPDGR